MVRKSRSITPILTLGATAVEVEEVVAAVDIEAAALAAVAAEDLVAIDEEAVAMEAVVVAEEADLEVDAAAAVVATTATRKDISLANALRAPAVVLDTTHTKKEEKVSPPLSSSIVAVEVATTDPVSKLESCRVAPQFISVSNCLCMKIPNLKIKLYKNSSSSPSLPLRFICL